jgi:hypothetical protein
MEVSGFRRRSFGAVGRVAATKDIRAIGIRRFASAFLMARKEKMPAVRMLR